MLITFHSISIMTFSFHRVVPRSVMQVQTLFLFTSTVVGTITVWCFTIWYHQSHCIKCCVIRKSIRLLQILPFSKCDSMVSRTSFQWTPCGLYTANNPSSLRKRRTAWVLMFVHCYNHQINIHSEILQDLRLKPHDANMHYFLFCWCFTITATLLPPAGWDINLWSSGLCFSPMTTTFYKQLLTRASHTTEGLVLGCKNTIIQFSL